MSDSYTRLNVLLDAVVAGNATSDDFQASCSELKGYHGRAYEAYHGSLDASKALHDAVLPSAVIWDQSHSYFGYEFSILLDDYQFVGCSKHNPARAWLITILKALIAQSPKPS